MELRALVASFALASCALPAVGCSFPVDDYSTSTSDAALSTDDARPTDGAAGSEGAVDTTSSDDATADPCAPRTTCGGECVDTTRDGHHCGDCTTVCSGGQKCKNGVCAPD